MSRASHVFHLFAFLKYLSYELTHILWLIEMHLPTKIFFVVIRCAQAWETNISAKASNDYAISRRLSHDPVLPMQSGCQTFMTLPPYLHTRSACLYCRTYYICAINGPLKTKCYGLTLPVCKHEMQNTYRKLNRYCVVSAKSSIKTTYTLFTALSIFLSCSCLGENEIFGTFSQNT